MMELAGKVAIVTGAGGGIGRAVSIALAENGADVIVNDIDEKKAERVCNEIRALGRRSLAFVADVSKSREVQALVQKTVEEFGTVDILVNIAGVSTLLFIEDLTEDDWDRVVDINLKGAFLCSQAVTSIMKKNRSGKIINISSTGAKLLCRGSGPNYTASKAGLLGLTRHFAFELAHYNINVNAVCPGPTLSEIAPRTAEQIEFTRQRIPIGRWSTPEDQASVVVFLASERARQIVGASIDVDGGWPLDFGGNWEEYSNRREWVAGLMGRRKEG